jgi:hypothetical protein
MHIYEYFPCLFIYKSRYDSEADSFLIKLASSNGHILLGFLSDDGVADNFRQVV